MTLHNDDDLQRAAQAIDATKTECEGVTITDEHTAAQAVLDAVLPAYTARVTEPYKQALRELRDDFTKIANITAQHANTGEPMKAPQQETDHAD